MTSCWAPAGLSGSWGEEGKAGLQEGCFIQAENGAKGRPLGPAALLPGWDECSCSPPGPAQPVETCPPPRFSLSPWLSLQEMPPGHWGGPGICSQGKVCLVTQLRVGAAGKSNRRAPILKIIYSFKQCSLPGAGREPPGRGERRRGAIITLGRVCRGLETLAYCLPCPGKHLRRFSNNPQCLPTWAGYGCCRR